MWIETSWFCPGLGVGLFELFLQANRSRHRAAIRVVFFMDADFRQTHNAEIRKIFLHGGPYWTKILPASMSA
jgi:hypothetical protein